MKSLLTKARNGVPSVMFSQGNMSIIRSLRLKDMCRIYWKVFLLPAFVYRSFSHTLQYFTCTWFNRHLIVNVSTRLHQIIPLLFDVTDWFQCLTVTHYETTNSVWKEAMLSHDISFQVLTSHLFRFCFVVWMSLIWRKHTNNKMLSQSNGIC